MTNSELLQQKLSESRPLVMGVLNITPDSFSDGGNLLASGLADRDKVLFQAEQMVNEGVDIFDVGGESTRPGAKPVGLQLEMDRVLPVLEWLTTRFDTPVSVDTSSTELMKIAASKGAALLNDVRSLQREGALQAASESGLPVCLMHMQGEPDVMQDAPGYSNVVEDVLTFLEQRIVQCVQAGIAKEKILVDPGFGFGKTLQQNLMLFRGIPRLLDLDCPLLIGVSRKTMVGQILDKPVDERLQGSVALAMLAARLGAKIIRVHDVGETVDALRILSAVDQA